MSPPISLFMCHEAQESQKLFLWPFRPATETEPIPNPVVDDSELDAGKSKMRKGLWKPNTELPPNRIAEIAIFFTAMSWICGGQQIPDALFPGAQSLRILKSLGFEKNTR